MEGPARERRFAAALRRFDEANDKDPQRELLDGAEHGREVVYARWLSDWVLKLSPHASEALQLAARSQHICRWTIPRSSYPATRRGYLRWREALKRFHAEKSGEILRELGYPEDLVKRVQVLNLKQNFPGDPESRVLEDALCLVFLAHQFRAMIPKTAEAQLASILQKTWQKMTPGAQALARELPYSPEERNLLKQALGNAGQGTGRDW